MYPVLFIAIYGDVGYSLDKKPITGIHISSSYKNKSGEWWNEHSDNALIPLELMPELNEMLLEVSKHVA